MMLDFASHPGAARIDMTAYTLNTLDTYKTKGQKILYIEHKNIFHRA
jgi:hypothetical protein